MKAIFPDPIRKLPQADIPLSGVKAFLSQAEQHQVLFMTFNEDADLPEHSHAAQIGFVLDGRQYTFTRGDRYTIPAGVKHSGKIYKGYMDITFFDEPSRYPVKLASV